MMNVNKYLIALAVVVTTVASQSAVARETAEDSAYQWGRWAVLSPAAGGQPYQAPLAPGADNNYRPGDFFDPELQAQTTPPTPVPIVTPNPPGSLPPGSDPRGSNPIFTPPVAVPNPGGSPVAVPSPGGQTPSSGPRGT